ncbi:MAG: hypothetical protein RSD26_03655 [Cellulosilyticaceae bacterium]
MVEVLEDLKSTNILHKKNVSDLKSTIEQRYPNSSSEYKSKLFAHAIHKIIDRNISHFDKDLQPHIKSKLLQQVIKKDIFDITAYDIFEVCSSLQVSNEHYFENLTTWINTTQSTAFSKEQVCELLHAPKQTLPVVKDPTILEDTLVIESPPPLTTTIAPISSRHYLSHILSHLKIHPGLLLLTLIIIIAALIQIQSPYKSSAYSEAASASPHMALSEDALPIRSSEDLLVGPDNHLQNHLQYKEINEETLSDYLTGRGSLLVEEPYFNSIIDIARDFNINPLLMFAITGQEQGFVPKSNPQAESIVNNPFNVFGSWQDFNTDIKDTSSIAARTILNLSKGCPEDEDPIKWLNKQYAEDPNWHVGVSQILNQLEDIAGQ